MLCHGPLFFFYYDGKIAGTGFSTPFFIRSNITGKIFCTVMKLKDQLQLKVYKKNKTVRVLKLPKTESSIRKVFLPKSVAEMLVEWKKGQDKIKEPDICSEMQRGNIGNLTEIN